jgi:hypothetical protein
LVFVSYYFLSTNFLIKIIPTPSTATADIVIIAICTGVILSSPVGFVIVNLSAQNSSSSLLPSSVFPAS